MNKCDHIFKEISEHKYFSIADVCFVLVKTYKCIKCGKRKKLKFW